MTAMGQPTLVALLALTPLTACAHLTKQAIQDQRPFYVNLERNTVVRTPSEDTLLFEAQAAGHVFLYDGLPSAFNVATGAAGQDGARARATRVIFSPIFRVRQLNDSSSAVRTPSFMPRLMVEEDWVLRSPRDSAPAGFPLHKAIHIVTAQAGLQHHSNGQAGCFRDGFQPKPSDYNTCEPKPNADTSVIKLNRANGDFSTTFLTTSATYTYVSTPHSAELSPFIASATLGYDYHLPWIFGHLSDEQRELYKSHRLRVKGELMYNRGGWRNRLFTDYELAPKVDESLQRRMDHRILNYRYSVEFSSTADRFLGTGVIVRYHDGQDYYNIGFATRRKTWSIGIVLDVAGRRVGLIPVGND